MAADEIDPMVISPKPVKSLKFWTCVFSSGKWHSSTKADAPKNPKFQPFLIKIRTTKNL